MGDKHWSSDELIQLRDEVENQNLKISHIAKKHGRSIKEIRDEIIEQELSYQPDQQAKDPELAHIGIRASAADKERLRRKCWLFRIFSPYIDNSIPNGELLNNLSNAAKHYNDKPIYLWDYISKEYSLYTSSSYDHHYNDSNTQKILAVKNNNPEAIESVSKEVFDRISQIIQSNPIQSNPITL